MSKNILITGGSGLLGRELTKALLALGHAVSHLSRSPGKNLQVKTFLWDVNKGQIDPHCVDGVDTIIHLAGAGIADKRWTDERKREILDSRTKSIGLIYGLMKSKAHKVRTVISASGINYYGNRGDELLTEDSTPADDFIGNCCVEWEKAVDEGKQFDLRILKFRTGVVLTTGGGALPQLALPVKLAIGSPLGTGMQWVPWIHHQDAIGIYLHGLANEHLTGIYNMVAPLPVTNKELTTAVAKQLRRPLWAPNIPAFLIKLLFGEMAVLVLGSTKASAQKIEEAGFKFKYLNVSSALKEIYG
ncbi:TIGR01777 family oxidoreductase [Mucilaginibacter sp. RB4R14]|uniref:TIGR01777 family oxidoreductase n=1 Tax=Mucilaginibacter aurantiaciroseus TaxID=2949308 RepID=UPI0020903653|nr:TIGR01777 family oxidoreductase [Mucilaginibacter aurantiaciroseus]MCO5934034.1 TIGR01777 family oxidoreductase [Mucilaginibacter aurantiaciroseus]